MFERDSDFDHDYGPLGLTSARRIVPLLTAAMSIGSVADFGCDRGAWRVLWHESGAELVEIRAADLGEPVELRRRFDLVQSLGVGELVAPEKAGQFVNNLVAHGTQVLFAAAAPKGRGGPRPLEYWRRLFRARGYVPFDYLRPLVADDPAVHPLYRYNTLLYVREDRAASLPFPVRARRVPESAPIPDYLRFGRRLRHAMARCLPGAIAEPLVRPRAGIAARPV